MSNGLHNHLPLQYYLYVEDIFPWIGLYRTGSPISFRQKSPLSRQFGRVAYFLVQNRHRVGYLGGSYNLELKSTMVKYQLEHILTGI